VAIIPETDIFTGMLTLATPGLLYTMLERCRREALLYGKRKFRFKPAVTGCQHGGITLGLPCDTLKAAPLRIANQVH